MDACVYTYIEIIVLKNGGGAQCVCVCVCEGGYRGFTPKHPASFLPPPNMEGKEMWRKERKKDQRERERERACYLFATRIHPLTFR